MKKQRGPRGVRIPKEEGGDPAKGKRDISKDKYTPEMVEKVCLAIATSDKRLEDIFRDPELPHVQTIYRWRFMYPEFAEKFLEAKKCQIFVKMDKLEDVAASKEYYVPEKGSARIDPGSINSAKLQCEILMWQASTLESKIFGQKIQNSTDLNVRKHEDFVHFMNEEEGNVSDNIQSQDETTRD